MDSMEILDAENGSIYSKLFAALKFLHRKIGHFSLFVVHTYYYFME